MPKGVMWRHDDLWEALGRGANAMNGNVRPETLAEHCSAVAARGPGPRHVGYVDVRARSREQIAVQQDEVHVPEAPFPSYCIGLWGPLLRIQTWTTA